LIKHIVRINGGLGNQLFQYAFGLALSSATNSIVKFDLYDLKHNTGFSIREFHLNNIIKKKQICSRLERYLYLFRRVKRFKYFHFLFPLICIEKKFTYDPIYFKTTSSTYFIGYWQSFKYLDILSRTDIYNFKILFNDLTYPIFNTDNSVCIHVRRGDYLKLKNLYIILDFDYYYKAICQIKKINPDISDFIVFSDDIDLAKELLSFDHIRFHFVNNEAISDYCQFKMMIKFKYFIIANSTFSLWAAFLSNTNEKFIISPKNWFTVQSNLSISDLIPLNWIKL